VLIGELAGAIHGSDDVARRIEVTPSLKPDNLARLAAALGELGARDPQAALENLGAGTPTACATRAGVIAIVPTPTGSRGYDDLRRAATREPIGSGVRPSVASLADLIRLADAPNDPELQARGAALRRVAELGIELGIEL
jgi:hypothetical protein